MLLLLYKKEILLILARILSFYILYTVKKEEMSQTLSLQDTWVLCIKSYSFTVLTFLSLDCGKNNFIDGEDFITNIYIIPKEFIYFD